MVCDIINPVLTDLECHDTHCCSVIQDGKTALDRVRERKLDEDNTSRYDEIIKYDGN